ncbi:MAG: DinB family protein [Chloroflexota bacterium]
MASQKCYLPPATCYLSPMLDFTSVRTKEITMAELAAGLTKEDLRRLTQEMVDTMLGLLAECEDRDVTFVPDDPAAYDEAAVTEAELYLPWTLGHVIVHTTASAEESAFLAAELARGVAYHGRSRYEVPWPTITTVAQCRQRLKESGRLRLASLDLWPNPPHLDNTYQAKPGGEAINAANRFLRGLAHDDSHLAQIKKIVRQAQRIASSW